MSGPPHDAGPGSAGDAPVGGTRPSGTRVGVSELRRRVGNRTDVERTAELGGLATTVAAVAGPGLVDYRVQLEAIADGVRVTGVVEVPWTGACRRCLDPTGGVVEAPVAEVFSDEPVEGETWPLDGDAVELAGVLHDAAVLALPLAPLCRPDCPGPAPESFPVATEDGGAERSPDPRWAALSELRFDADEDEGLT